MRNTLLVGVVVLLFASGAMGSVAGAAQVQAQYDEGAPVSAQQTGDLNCAEFSSQAEAQAEFESDRSDPHNLDADNDGQACEDFDYGGASGNSTAPSGAASATQTDGSKGSGSFRCELFLRMVRDDQGALRAQYQGTTLGNQYQGDELVQRLEQCLSGEVLASTIPKGVLPNTGGPSLLSIAALPFLLTGAGIVVRLFRAARSPRVPDWGRAP
jgi:hypothetical protein